jgi:GT2 family glycosyltransferase
VGLERQTRAPDDVVVVSMGDDDVTKLAAASAVVSTSARIEVASGAPLPLAAARNRAADAASGDLLVFLDVDCIPAERLVADFLAQARPGLLMGSVRYLPPGVPSSLDGWTDDDLRRAGRAHPARPEPGRPVRTERYELFWSLDFACDRATWRAVGGFDEGYQGYGGEDTDLAFEARRRGVPAWFVPGAEAFHQHHEACDPPVQHLADIVANARRFHDKWGIWPMTGWLEAFAAQGLVTWDGPDLALPEAVDGPAAERVVAR